MKLSSKIIFPILFLLVVIFGAFGYIYYDLKQQGEVISQQETKIQKLNSLNERLIRQQEETDYNLLSYRFNQDKAYLSAISQAELDKSKTLDEIYPFMSSPRGRELVNSYIITRKEVELLRNDLVKAINEGDKEQISFRYNRWSIQTKNIKAALSDIGAFNINSLEKTLVEVGAIRDTIAHIIVILALFVIATVIFLYFYFRVAITQPIIKLAAIADQLANTDFSTSIPTTDTRSQDEVGQLSRAFNKMAGKIKESFSTEKARDRAILESVGDGLVATDSAGLVVFMNRWAEFLVGYRQSQLAGEKWVDRVPMVDANGHPIAKTKRLSEQVLSSGKKLFSRGNFYVRIDGKKFPVAITATPVIMQEKVIGVVTVFRDITPELAAERAKDEFLAIASHELRTPLAVISGNSSMLLDRPEKISTTMGKEILSDIYTESQRLISLVGNFLDVSKINLNKIFIKIKPVDLAELTAKSISGMESLAKQRGLVMKYIRPKQLPKVFADGERVKQIFTNLLGNAIRYTDKGKIEVSQRIADGVVETVISDTGQGIKKSQQSTLFKKFTPISGDILTRKSGSTGLGLYISKQLVEKMGGKLYLIKSLPGEGSSFGFSLRISTSAT